MAPTKPKIIVMPGLSKEEAEDNGQIFTDTGWTIEIIKESNNTFTLKATPPASP